MKPLLLGALAGTVLIIIGRAFSIAETRGEFRIDEVRPVDAARRIRIPVLLIHGSDDTDTPPDRSRRVLAALAGPKELLLVDGARHNESLRSAATWQRIAPLGGERPARTVAHDLAGRA